MTTVAAESFAPPLERARLATGCAAIVRAARTAGADEAEAFASSSRTITVRFEKTGLKLASSAQGSSFGARVFVDRRLGFCATNSTRDDALGGCARDALTVARLSPAATENRLPTVVGATGAQPDALWSADLAAFDVERAVALARENYDAMLAADPRLAIDQASLSLWQGARAVHSSAGAGAEESDCGLSFSVMGMAKESGGEVGGFHFCGDFTRDPAQIGAILRGVREEFVTVALGNLAAGAAESYVGPVLFAPAAFAAIFVEPLLSAASALAVQRGRSALAGKLGALVAVPELTVIDDPLADDLAGAATFDREGVPCARRVLVERGELRSYLYNSLAGNVEGRPSSGHAQGGARSVPGLGAHAPCIAPGSGGTLDELLAKLGRGLYVERFSGTVDPASGDFSGVAKSARWVEGGERVRAVGETLLSGNAFALLAGALELAGTSERRGGRLRVPAALVDGVAVTAG